MKKRLKQFLLVLFTVLAATLTFAGCTLNKTLDDITTSKNLTAQVTYYANGGMFNDKSVVKNMYYKADSQALNIGVVIPNSGSTNITRENFEFAGWYYVNSVVDAEKGICSLSSTPVDFTQTLQEGDHWQIGAYWKGNGNIKVKLVVDGTDKIIVDENTQYGNGDYVLEKEYGTNDTAKLEDAPFTLENKSYTFVAYYTDAACQNRLLDPTVVRDDPNLVYETREDGTKDAVLYAKYIAGNWKIVDDKTDVRSMFNLMGTEGKYWLLTDIDASNVYVAPDCLTALEIEGNGHTISGVTFQYSTIIQNVTPTNAMSGISIFGTIKSTAKIRNLTLTNTTLDVDFGQNMLVNLYYVFSNIEEGATIENVKLSGSVSVKVKGGASIINLNNLEELVYTQCLFGGYATDDEYLAATENNGFVVEGNPSEFIILK